MVIDMSARIQVVVGDITKLAVDAVVTSANEALCGGGGVDGAVHHAAGPALLEECLKIGYCPPGEARLTGAYLLPAKYIIHTVGPVWEQGYFGEVDVLAGCYRACLRLAEKHGVRTIAFPSLATGVNGYPREEASQVAATAVSTWLDAHPHPDQVVFCCLDAENAELYRHALQEHGVPA